MIGAVIALIILFALYIAVFFGCSYLFSISKLVKEEAYSNRLSTMRGRKIRRSKYKIGGMMTSSDKIVLLNMK
jgi:hypothetical protein